MKIREQFVTSRDRTYSGTNPCLWLTVHETGNVTPGADAAAHADLQSSGNVRNASWHESIDKDEAVLSFPDEVQCWHAGDGDKPDGGNCTSYSFELCVPADGDYDQALANLRERVRAKRAQHGIDRAHVVQHNHWSGKDCPRILRSMGPKAWAEFVASTDPKESPAVATLISPYEGRLTSSWGWREILGRSLTFHRGQDIAPPIAGTRGLPVYAPVDMTIVYVTAGTYSKAQGKWLGNGYTSTWNTGPLVVGRGRGKWKDYHFAFGHMEGITVKKGDVVDVGHVLGKAFDLGNVQGIHLHFEVWKASTQGGGNGAGNTIDPAAFYRKHGVVLGSAPDFTKTPTNLDRKDWLDMDADELNRHLSRHAENTVKQTTDNVRVLIAKQNEALHKATRTEVEKGVEDVLRRLPAVPGVTATDVERIRVAILGDKHPAMPGTDMRGLAVSTYRDLQTLRATVEALAGALAATSAPSGEAFDVDKFLDGIDQRIEARMAGLTDEVIDSLVADTTISKKE